MNGNNLSMEELKKNSAYSEELLNEVLPVADEKRILGTPSNFAIWFTCNFAITTMLCGMFLIPGLDFKASMLAIIAGCVAGAIPLVLIGIIGQKTGLVTMVACRATFGPKGAVIPSITNAIILIAWSWSQAALGGIALNYVSVKTIGFDNQTLFILLTEALVLVIALYAIKGISMFEKVAMFLVAAIIGAVIFKAFNAYGMNNILELEGDPLQGMTIMAAFDVSVTMALAWTPMVADYNRNCKSLKAAVLGTGAGYTLGTILSMGTGALLICMILVKGGVITYEPSEVFSEVGFGMAGALLIFISIIAANVMNIYSSSMSFLNVFPRFPYKKVAIVIGIICMLGAAFSGILDSFLEFINIIAALFMPIFAIMIADYFVVKKQKINIEAVVFPESHNDYAYFKGINLVAVIVFFVAAIFAALFTWVYPISTGVTIPTFFLAFFLYIVVMKITKQK